ncbi:MAG: L-seryl-tRNA(Sec) selenium transferase, partial [Haliea sp.]
MEPADASLASPGPASKARPQDLPSIDRLLRSAEVSALTARHGHTLVAGEARALLDSQRVLAL